MSALRPSALASRKQPVCHSSDGISPVLSVSSAGPRRATASLRAGGPGLRLDLAGDLAGDWDGPLRAPPVSPSASSPRSAGGRKWRAASVTTPATAPAAVWTTSWVRVLAFAPASLPTRLLVRAAAAAPAA